LVAAWHWILNQSDWLPHTILIIIAVTVLCQTYYPSRLLLSLFGKLWPDITFEFQPPGSTPGKFVALTINGGPCYMNTPKLLNLLEENDAKATFFILGNQVQLCDRVGAGSGKMEHGRGILREMVNQGHELANQGW
jgi:peptidoglycan/xylan/chitin deacetylase (PgdA/CDA1 family)